MRSLIIFNFDLLEVVVNHFARRTFPWREMRRMKELCTSQRVSGRIERVGWGFLHSYGATRGVRRTRYEGTTERTVIAFVEPGRLHRATDKLNPRFSLSSRIPASRYVVTMTTPLSHTAHSAQGTASITSPVELTQFVRLSPYELRRRATITTTPHDHDD